MNVTISHPTEKMNFSSVTVGELTIWFSYSTPIAFHTPDHGTVVRENVWGPTTGKHINFVSDDKSKRVASAEFEMRLENVTKRLNFTPIRPFALY